MRIRRESAGMIKKNEILALPTFKGPNLCDDYSFSSFESPPSEKSEFSPYHSPDSNLPLNGKTQIQQLVSKWKVDHLSMEATEPN